MLTYCRHIQTVKYTLKTQYAFDYNNSSYADMGACVCMNCIHTSSERQIENRESDKDTDVRSCERTKTVTILSK